MKEKFSHWACKTHNCSSFNMNNLVRHSMPWCDIVTSAKYLSKPKTIGGYNGDVSRKYYPDWIEYCQRKVKEKQDKENWVRQVELLNKDIESYQQTHINKYIDKMI